MIINVDLDGVVYDFHTSLMEYIYGKGGWLHLVTPRRWNVWEDWGMTFGEWNHWFRRAVEDGEVWGKGPMIPGARHYLWKLSDEGHHIRIVTDRLVHAFGHRAAVTATAQWLDDNNIPYRSLSFEGKKYLFASDNSVLIDDKPSNVNSFVYSVTDELTRYEAVLFAQPWNDVDVNYLQPTVRRLSGWEAVYEWINERS